LVRRFSLKTALHCRLPLLFPKKRLAFGEPCTFGAFCAKLGNDHMYSTVRKIYEKGYDMDLCHIVAFLYVSLTKI